ncbi:MAG: APC family permease [Methylacidiphilales bacterium]|nr:APC family permease [Candidatus Methylacidiphilales bacterium]
MSDHPDLAAKPPPESPSPKRSSGFRQMLFGKPRDLNDPSLFHSISLIPFLAWVGLGVDGLSSCAYGPDEAFRALFNPNGTDHRELAILLAIATTLTVAIISWSYSGLIEHFPYSGGGYGVATKLLGPYFGLISGCALLVDYVLTITTSIASGVDQIFNIVPVEFAPWKLAVELVVTGALVLLNLRGIKESINVIVPIFLLFVATHLTLMIGVFVVHPGTIVGHLTQIHTEVHRDAQNLGLWVLLVIFLQAYSRGAGTYTGIEAVSNGVSAMREPQVTNAKWTMLYMAISLAVTAGGLMICYLLADLEPVAGRTMNGLLVAKVNFGTWFSLLTLGSEAGLLLFAAQTGYIGGPRVMANMALDGWVPRRFSSLSDRLTSHYGVLLVGMCAIGSLIYTRGSVDMLVTMYAINVFVTFSLSQLGMSRFSWARRKRNGQGVVPILVHSTSFLLCFGILVAVVILKFAMGAWVTLFVTGVLISLCLLIHRHYERVRAKLTELNAQLGDMQTLVSSKSNQAPVRLDPRKQTAVMLVSSYGGLGIHTLLVLLKTFPGQYSQVYFASVGVLDSGNFKGTEEVERLRADRQRTIDQFVLLAQSLGLAADGEFTLGTDPVDESTRLCLKIREKYPRSVFFAGKLLFEAEKWYYPLLHNETAYAISRRLQLQGIPMVVMPIRILKFGE